jgi:hypothetical protein
MLVFILSTLAGTFGVVAWRSLLRYRTARKAEGKSGRRITVSDYAAWARPGLKKIFAASTWKRAFAILKDWAMPRYPGWTVGFLLALGLALAYQISSGFFFAFFIRRGLYGFPLLGHMAFGGLFALALSAVLLWRGRDGKILFWAFAFFGFIQVVTALGSMLPIFHYNAQGVFITTHRYGALGILLTVLVFLDLSLIPHHRS